VAGHAGQYRLDVLGQDMVAAVQQGPGPGGREQGQARAGGEPGGEIGAFAAAGQQGLDVVDQARADVDPAAGGQQGVEFASGEDGGQAGQQSRRSSPASRALSEAGSG
jgi:hypothetical protein